MKTILTVILVFGLFTLFGQPIKSFVNPYGIALKDTGNIERIILDGDTKCVLIQVNDSLTLKIQGDLTTSIKLFNNSSEVETGMELDDEGAFAFGQFQSFSPENLPISNVINGLYRPAPNTQALATDFTERLRITENGNIGIGTFMFMTPTERLDVDGGVRIRLIPEELHDNILVADPEGAIRFRHVSTLFPSEISSTESEILQKTVQNLDQIIQSLLKRVEALENKLAGH